MHKKLTTSLASAALTMIFANSALAAFADLELIRVVYERTTGTTETATDLGNVKSLIANGGAIAGTALSANNANNLFVAYFAADRTDTADGGPDFWVAGNTSTLPVAVGTAGFNSTKAAMTRVFSQYNATAGGAAVTGTPYTLLQSNANSYRTNMSASQGAMSNAINIATRPTIEARLADLVTGSASSLTQNLYYFSNANSGGSIGVAVATITTNADGSTTITALPVNSDTVSPLVTLSTASTSSSATIAVTFSATDNVAVTGYLLTETATLPLAGDAGWVASAPASYTFSGITPGVLTTKTVYAWAKDAAGNISAPVSAAVDITIPAGDTTPPSVTITSPSPFTSATVDIAFTITDDTGVTGYQLSEAGTPPAASDANWIAVSPAATSFSGNATHTFSTLDPGASSLKTLYVWARDEAQNVSNADPTANVQLTILKPVRITGNAPPLDPYFMQLQDAFNAVADGDSIQAMGNSFTEPVLNLNRPGASVTLKGGFDSGYAANTGGVSTLRGQLLISNGNLVTENLVIN